MERFIFVFFIFHLRCFEFISLIKRLFNSKILFIDIMIIGSKVIGKMKRDDLIICISFNSLALNISLLYLGALEWFTSNEIQGVDRNHRNASIRGCPKKIKNIYRCKKIANVQMILIRNIKNIYLSNTWSRVNILMPSMLN